MVRPEVPWLHECGPKTKIQLIIRSVTVILLQERSMALQIRNESSIFPNTSIDRNVFLFYHLYSLQSSLV